MTEKEFTMEDVIQASQENRVQTILTFKLLFCLSSDFVDIVKG